MTRYKLDKSNEYPFYIIEIDVDSMELLKKLDKVIDGTIYEHYYGDNNDK